MPDIDALVIRLDADLKPLKKALAEAEAISGRFAARMEKTFAQTLNRMPRFDAFSAQNSSRIVRTLKASDRRGSASPSSPSGGGRVIFASESGVRSEFTKPLTKRYEESQKPSLKDLATRGLKIGKTIGKIHTDPIPLIIENLPEGEQFDTHDLPPAVRAEDIIGLEESIRASRAAAEGMRGASGDVFREQGIEFEQIQEQMIRALERDLQAAFDEFKKLAVSNKGFSSEEGDILAPRFDEAAKQLADALREARDLVKLGDPQINAALEPDVARISESFARLAGQLEQTLGGKPVRNVEQLGELRNIPLEETAASKSIERLDAAAASATVSSDVQSASDLAQQICDCLKETMAEFGDDLAKKLCECREMAGNSLDPGGGGSLGHVPSDGGVIPPVFRLDADGAGLDGAGLDGEQAETIEDQAAAWQAVLKELDQVPPALAETRQATLDVNRVARDLGFTFASAFEDAVVEGESLSDVLQGLEQDMLRILTRTLITEPLARGLTAGLGAFTGGGLGSGGGLEGVIGGGLGALANLFPSPVAGVGLGTYNKIAPIAAQDVANPLLAGVFQTGGPVHGPGGPKGDRIPAFLSDGEFVVNAAA